MAAYAALVSLMHTIHTIERHPSPPISLPQNQVQSLTEKLNFLQEFLEGYNSPFDYSDEADPLEVRIADAAHAAEDVIETKIVDQIHSRSTSLGKVVNFSKLLLAYKCADTRDHFEEDLEKVIEEMELIEKDVTNMVREKAAVEPQLLHGNTSVDGARETKSEMVGCDDVLLQLLDRLTGGQSTRQIIPLVGMGGIGKTTLAKTVFGNALIKTHFDVCLWATISQDYNAKQNLDQVFSQIGLKSNDKSEIELQEELYKYLAGRRYLIVLDDMWSLEVWDNMKFFFPEYNNGSRILVTTRMSDLAVHLTDSRSLFDMRFLDEVDSWNLLSKTVFGEENFPIELERIGKRIVDKCKGLPLSLVVIGGLLAKSEHTLQYWRKIERNLSSESDEYCLSILKTSYNHLPAYLKPCFLYMGTFEEDSSIRVSKLVKLWVSEGFLKPRNNKSLETIGREYLKELVDRNLILVDKLGLGGNVKYCKIHDSLRDLSLKEAKKQRFYCVLGKEEDEEDSFREIDISIQFSCVCGEAPRLGASVHHRIGKDSPREGASGHRRIAAPSSGFYGELNANNNMLHVRSYLCHNDHTRELPKSRLLRTLINISDAIYYGVEYSVVDVLGFVNSRYVDVRLKRKKTRIPCSISQLWNLHTLITRSEYSHFTAPTEIWKMPQLRHVDIDHLEMPGPPSSKDDEDDIVVMENLHTLKEVWNLELNEEVVRRISNIKKLSISYDRKEKCRGLNFISRLHCLENLYFFLCLVSDKAPHLQICFPHSLKKLSLRVPLDCELDEGMLQMIGCLPLLQKLTLIDGVFREGKWETSDGQFLSLKVLELISCGGLANWMVSESSHFPLLQELRLTGLKYLKEIPSEIGEIPTLKSIRVELCSESTVLSAKKIVDEQEDLHGDQIDLHVKVYVYLPKDLEALRSLSGPNFEVQDHRYRRVES